MMEVRELLRGTSDSIPLDVAALQIGTIQNSDQDIDPYLVLLDSHAAEFGERVSRRTSTEDFIRLFNEYLFGELGFQGNATDYYDPANSCLQDVLTRRLGIPITLSIVYEVIGRRLGKRIYGIGLPGHFLVGVDEADLHAYVDPFHAGRLLTAPECFELAREATGMALEDNPDMLEPVSHRLIVIRMLNNLRAIYFRRRDPERAVQVLDLLIEAIPESPDEYKQRAICLAQVDRFIDAKHDFETYLRLAPEAVDRQQVALELDRIRRMIALQD
jgi:regulator of sirC expression with transglutaminase-like and TPR domain